MNLIKRLKPQNTLLFICDVQDKYTPKCYAPQSVLESVTMFCQLAEVFKIPVLITQQNPPVFGKTYQSFVDPLINTHKQIIEKTKFSMVNANTEKFLNVHKDRNQVLLVGLEAHICVYQTFADLTSRNYQVFIPIQAITSSRAIERTVGIQRMLSAGGVITSFENSAFQLLEDYKSDKFKSILSILKKNKRQKIMSHL